MSPSPSPPPHVYVLTSDERLWERLSASLAEAGLPVRRAPDAAVAAAPARGGALLLDSRTHDVDQILNWVRQTAGSRSTLPLFVLSEDAPPRESYLRWLDRGVWDVVRLPLEEQVLTLRLANVLRPTAPDHGGADTRASTPYSWAALARAAEETLALTRRYGRSVTCLALTLRSGEEDVEGGDRQLARRVARVAADWTRRSDLVGTDDEGNVLLLLPDTPESGAAVLLDRLSRALDEQLEAWGVTGTLEGRIAEAGSGRDGEELLRAALSAAPVPSSRRRIG